RRSEPQVYLSSQQVADSSITFYVPRALALRTSGAPSTVAPAVRAIVRGAEPRGAIVDVPTLEGMVERDTASRVTQVRVLGAFAAIAFVLAAVSIHGLLSFAVSQRTQEIGVRIALGARWEDVVSLIVANALRLGAIGLVVGAVLAYAAG